MGKASDTRSGQERGKVPTRPSAPSPLPSIVGFVCLALIAPVVVWSALEPPPRFLLKWGTAGNGNGQFIQPEGIAVGSDGSVFVTDVSTNSVQKFTAAGEFLLRWGSLGSADGQFDGPTDAACDGAGNVYVSDLFNGRVQRFDENGNFLGKFPIVGAAYALAVDPAGEYVYVTSGGRIEKFTADGVFVLMWAYDVGPVPTTQGVAVGPSGHVYITARGDHRVVKFTPTGTLVMSWGGGGTAEGQFNGPWGVATDATKMCTSQMRTASRSSLQAGHY